MRPFRWPRNWLRPVIYFLWVCAIFYGHVKYVDNGFLLQRCLVAMKSWCIQQSYCHFLWPVSLCHFLWPPVCESCTSLGQPLRFSDYVIVSRLAMFRVSLCLYSWNASFSGLAVHSTFCYNGFLLQRCVVALKSRCIQHPLRRVYGLSVCAIFYGLSVGVILHITWVTSDSRNLLSFPEAWCFKVRYASSHYITYYSCCCDCDLIRSQS